MFKQSFVIVDGLMPEICGCKDSGTLVSHNRVVIEAPECLASSWLMKKIPHFLQHFPHIELEVSSGVKNPVMLPDTSGIGLHIGTRGIADYRKEKIASVGFNLYASACYLQRNKHPDTLQDLVNHCVIDSVGDIFGLPHASEHKKLFLSCDATLSMNSVLAQHTAAINGLGIAILPNYLINKKSTLIPLLSREYSVKHDLLLVYRHAKFKNRYHQDVWNFLSDALDKEHHVFCTAD